MMQRSRLMVNVGNLLEPFGAAAGVYGVYRLEGLAWALIAVCAAVLIAAELIYDGHVWSVPLPHRPRPRQRFAETRSRLSYWWTRRRARRASS